jgi:small-conductance mechanosensitive channel
VRLRIEQAITDYRATRTAAGVQDALSVAGLETLIYLIALGAIALLWRLASRLIHRHVDGRVTIWEKRARDVVQLRAIWDGIRRVLLIGFILAGLVATAIYANTILLTLPWTRDAGRRLAGVLVDPLLNLWSDFLGAVPEMIVLAVIAALTIFVARIVDRFFAAVGARRLTIGNFEPEWARPTARLARVGVILLGLVMAYPYIPGSSSEAFRAISIFAGVLFSLGASSIVANALAGNSLIYRRAFRVGDRVEIAGVIGDVEGLSAQATFLRTPKNERVTLPNSLVLGSQVVFRR